MDSKQSVPYAALSAIYSSLSREERFAPRNWE